MPGVRDLQTMAGAEPITMLTAYDATTAALVDDADVEVILVGDSMGRETLGFDSTLPVTVDDMARHVGAVARSTEDALVVADMPFLSIGVDRAQSVEHCGRMIKEEGANAVKLESGPHTVELTEHLTDLGIPVMAHLGLTPQSHNLTDRVRQATTREAAREQLDLAKRHAEAGAFSLVLEHVPANVAAQITDAIDIPTIGIGAGPDCDGQVLVVNDVLGLTESPPPFSASFGDVRSAMTDAISAYRAAVKDGEYPAAEHTHADSTLDDIA